MGIGVVKLVSGGQTGTDRAALDFAIEHGIPHGGWCPAGRLAEDGPIDPRYLLSETPSGNMFSIFKSLSRRACRHQESHGSSPIFFCRNALSIQGLRV